MVIEKQGRVTDVGLVFNLNNAAGHVLCKASQHQHSCSASTQPHWHSYWAAGTCMPPPQRLDRRVARCTVVSHFARLSERPGHVAVSR